MGARLFFLHNKTEKQSQSFCYRRAFRSGRIIYRWHEGYCFRERETSLYLWGEQVTVPYLSTLTDSLDISYIAFWAASKDLLMFVSLYKNNYCHEDKKDLQTENIQPDIKHFLQWNKLHRRTKCFQFTKEVRLDFISIRVECCMRMSFGWEERRLKRERLSVPWVPESEEVVNAAGFRRFLI